MTPLAKVLAVTAAVGIIVAGTIALRPHPAPAVERSKLTPAQLVEIQPPKAEPAKPEPPKAVVSPPGPWEDEAEDGSGS